MTLTASPNISALATQVIEALVAEGKLFTAYDVTREVRRHHSDIDVPHRSIRKAVQSWYAGSGGSNGYTTDVAPSNSGATLVYHPHDATDDDVQAVNDRINKVAYVLLDANGVETGLEYDDPDDADARANSNVGWTVDSKPCGEWPQVELDEDASDPDAVPVAQKDDDDEADDPAAPGPVTDKPLDRYDVRSDADGRIHIYKDMLELLDLKAGMTVVASAAKPENITEVFPSSTPGVSGRTYKVNSPSGRLRIGRDLLPGTDKRDTTGHGHYVVEVYSDRIIIRGAMSISSGVYQDARYLDHLPKT